MKHTNVLNLPWRVGRKLGRTVYAQWSDDPADSDILLGMFDDAAVAAHMVYCHNAALRAENEPCC